MITVNTVPVSVLSLIMPIHHSNQRMLLAIGKFSGSFEVWTCDISSQKFERTGSCNAHDQVVSFLLSFNLLQHTNFDLCFLEFY